jgi:hypothetical protein
MKRVLFVQMLLIAGVAFPALADYLECPAMPSGTRLRAENRYFDVTPRIVPADAEAMIEITPRFDHARFREGCTYEITYVPTERRAQMSGWVPGVKAPVTPENGRYQFKMFFEGEQEHVLFIEETCGDKKRVFGDFRVYSLAPDLFALRPYKGDFHMHSHHSDGVESPAYVAGACRRVGLDFMALTDHKKYAPSIEAKQAYDGVPIDLRIYPGEEVHPPDNPVHLLSFGANAGISELYQDEAAYRAEVQAVADALPELPPGVDRFQYASCVWGYGKIRERGGLGMFCHAYWFTSHQYYVPEALVDHLFETQPFDMLELISGFGWQDLHEIDVNALQVARYQEERSKGKRIPICGISDTHGVERSDAFGRYYTICFAPSPELPDIKASIMGLNSVAVEAVRGDLPRAYGPFRLVRYAQFLLREVFPQHDELCFEEGRLMIQYASGDSSARDRLALAQGQIGRLYDRYWAPAT